MNWTREEMREIDKVIWTVAEELGGPRWDSKEPEAFIANIRRWLDKEPDKFLPWAVKSREAILSLVTKHGLSSSAELPEFLREALDQHCQTVVASTMQEVNHRLQGELRRASPARQIMILERAKLDLDEALEKVADVNERERKGWVKLILPLRDDCQRAAKKLRKKL